MSPAPRGHAHTAIVNIDARALERLCYFRRVTFAEIGRMARTQGFDYIDMPLTTALIAGSLLLLILVGLAALYFSGRDDDSCGRPDSEGDD